MEARSYIVTCADQEEGVAGSKGQGCCELKVVGD